MSDAILVTGAAGFAGSHLLELLRGVRAPVVGWHRPGHEPPAIEGRSEAVDILDRASVYGAIARTRPSVVYHCAGAAHVGQAWEAGAAALSTNVRATHYLLEALRATDTDVRILVPSSALVYQPSDGPLAEGDSLVPTSPYGLGKLAQELLACHAASSRVHVTIARAFNHTGPRQAPAFATSGFARQIAWIEAGRQPPEIVVGNLEARRDVTDVRDTVNGYRLMVERGRSGRAYNICSGQAVAIGEILGRLVARAHGTIRVRVDPSLFRPNDVPLLLGDPTRAREELGWCPEIPLDQTLDDTLDYWRARVNTS